MELELGGEGPCSIAAPLYYTTRSNILSGEKAGEKMKGRTKLSLGNGYGKVSGGISDGVASGLVEKDILRVVAVHISDNGVCNEESKEGANEENEDTDVQNPTGSEKGRGLVDRLRIVEEIIVLLLLVVYRGVVDISFEAASHGWWRRGIF